MRPRSAKREFSFRLDQELHTALTTYCSQTKSRKRDVITEAIEHVAPLLRANGDWTKSPIHYLYIRKARGPKRPAVVIGTVLSLRTMAMIAELKGRESSGRFVNRALRDYFWSLTKNRVREYNADRFSHFGAPLPTILSSAARETFFKKLPPQQILMRNSSGIPNGLQETPVLVDSSFLLGLMLRMEKSLYEPDNPKAGRLLERFLLGDVILVTTTAQIAEFSELAIGIFTAKIRQDTRSYFDSTPARDLPRTGSVNLLERLHALPASGIAVIPVEAGDYASACQLNHGTWPVSLAKLAGLSALGRMIGSDEVYCLSLFRTENNPALPVWERFKCGHCFEASSNDPSYEKYRERPLNGSDLDDAEKPLPLRAWRNPCFKNLHGLRV